MEFPKNKDNKSFFQKIDKEIKQEFYLIITLLEKIFKFGKYEYLKVENEIDNFEKLNIEIKNLTDMFS